MNGWGGASTVWDLSAQNWTTDGGQTKCAFVTGGDAVFNLADAGLSLTFGAAVKPATVSVTAAANKTLTLDFNNGGSKIFETTSTVEKKGSGTLYFSRTSSGTGDFPDDSVLDIQAGVVVINSRNVGGLCAPKNITLHSGTTLQVANASTLGNLGAISKTSIQTAGKVLFDGPGGDYGNVIKDLTIEPGAVFEARKAGHVFFNGILQIQRKVIVKGDGRGARTMTLSTPAVADYQRFVADAHSPVEFEVGDATDSPATDLTVTGPYAFYQADKSGTATGNTTVGFRKTGEGTMLWQNSYADGNASLNGTVAVEAGTLLFAAGQTLPNATVSVAADAAVGGSGTVGNLTIAEGAVLSGRKGQAAALVVSGNVAFPQNGTIDIVTDGGDEPGEFAVPVLDIRGAVSGDVSGWSVSINGVVSPDSSLSLSDGMLIANVTIVLPEYTWVGGASTSWNLTDANWTTDGGQTKCAFVEGADAHISPTQGLTLTLGAAVNPSTITYDSSNWTILDYASGINNVFKDTSSVVKKGSAVLFFRHSDQNYGVGNFPSESVLDIQQGTARVASRNKGGQCTPKNVVIHSGATFMISDASTIGNLASLSPTSIRTAGKLLFDGDSNGDYGNTLKTLTIESGATFEAKKAGSSYCDGLLHIQEKVVVEGDGNGARTLALSTPTTASYQRFVADASKPLEFEVGDATESAATDLTVSGPFVFLREDKSGRKTGSTVVGFRKTGAGTMLWQNSSAAGNEALNGTVAVEAGTLLFAAGQALPNATVSVAAGAAVGGSATLRDLTLAEGSALVGTDGQMSALTVTGDLALPQEATIEITTEGGVEPGAGFVSHVLSVKGAVTGDVSGWTLKVNGVERSDIRFSLLDGEIAVGAFDYVWTGAASSVWDLTALNWTTDDGVSSCAFVSGRRACFTGATDKTIALGAVAVNPDSMCVSNTAGTIKFDFTTAGGSKFAATKTVTKRGAGTLSFYRPNSNSSGTADFPSESVLDIQEGTVLVNCRNRGGYCTPKNIVISSGTTLQIAEGSSLGNMASLSSTSIRIAGQIYVDGTAGDYGNPIKNLILEPGATFATRKAGSAYLDGLLQIQEKVIVAGDGKGARTMTLTSLAAADYQRFSADASKPLEFEVGDATESAATDLTVTGPFTFLREDKSGRKTGSTVVGFRKTGTGTMLWQNSYAAGNEALNGTIAVEAGALLFAADQTIGNAVVSVAAGAAVGGSGSLGNLTLAAGAGLVVGHLNRHPLTVDGAVSIPATGTLVLDIPAGVDVSEFRGYFLRATSYEGVANLRNWTLVAPGYEGELPAEIEIFQNESGLYFGRRPGLSIIVR